MSSLESLNSFQQIKLDEFLNESSAYEYYKPRIVSGDMTFDEVLSDIMLTTKDRRDQKSVSDDQFRPIVQAFLQRFDQMELVSQVRDDKDRLN